MPIAFPCFCTRTRGRQPHSVGHRLTQPRCAACPMTPGISATCGNGIRRSSHRAPEPSIPRYRATASVRPQPVPWFRSAVFSNFPSTACRNTLRAGTDGARGAFTSPRPIHYRHDRCITVREMARLHGFPDWFRLNATKWHGARQIGNAVPPPLSRVIAAQVMKALGAIPTRPDGTLVLGNPNLLTHTLFECGGAFRGDGSAQQARPEERGEEAQAGRHRRRTPRRRLSCLRSSTATRPSSIRFLPTTTKKVQPSFSSCAKNWKKEPQLSVFAVKNLGDVPYSFRYRNVLPNSILETQPEGKEWIIVGPGKVSIALSS